MEWESDSPCQSHTYARHAGLLEGAAVGSWSLGLVEQSQCKGYCWLWKDGSRGCEGGDRGGKCLWRKARQPWKQGDTAESHVEGVAITRASLSPQASLGSWTTESLAHQTPDALNYRVGPTQGAPFSAWCANLQSRTPIRGPLLCAWCIEQQKDPRQGIPLSAWTGRTTENNWPNKPSDH